MTDRVRGFRNDPAWEANADVRLNPDSIAKVGLWGAACTDMSFSSPLHAYRPTSTSLSKTAQLGLGRLIVSLLTLLRICANV